jgi:hypothetical protein
MDLPCDLDQMNAQQLRDLTASLIHTVNQQAELLKSRQLKIDQLTHEMATLKRWRFARRSEQIDAVQRSLLEESIDEDLQAIELELEALRSAPDVPQFDPLAAVIYDFADSRSGKHARAFLEGWSGKLVCDDFSGYKALFEREVVEVGCLAHARRKFHDLHENHRSQIAADALVFFGALYDVETRAREKLLDATGRQRLRQLLGRPIADSLHQWLILHRQKVPEGSATAKAIDYSLKRWKALMCYLDDGDLPIDNNWLENRIRPVTLGRSNWLFAGLYARGAAPPSS